MGLRTLAEDLNLKTDRRLKGYNIRNLSDQELIASLATARSGAASGATGMGIHGLLACAGWGPSMFAAGVSTVQLGVASSNRDRVDDELERRKNANPKFRRLLEQADRPFRDVAVGSSVKMVTSAITLGVAGVLDGSELVNKSFGTDAVPSSGQTALSGSAEFAAKYPDAAEADQILKGITAPVGDLVADQLQAETGLPIDDKTTWAELKAMDPTGTHTGAIMAQAAAVGIAGEANPAPLIAEHAANKTLCNSAHNQAQKAANIQKYA